MTSLIAVESGNRVENKSCSVFRSTTIHNSPSQFTKFNQKTHQATLTESYRQIRLWFGGMHRCDRLWVPRYPSWMVISWNSPCEKTTRTLQQIPANDYILRDAIGRVTPGWSAISSKCVRNLKCRHGTFRVVWGLCRDWIEMMEIKDSKILGGLKVSLPNTLAWKKPYLKNMVWLQQQFWWCKFPLFESGQFPWLFESPVGKYMWYPRWVATRNVKE